PVPPGQVSDWVAAGVALAGKPPSWVPDEVIIAMHESGGDPRSINTYDINAQRGDPSIGLLQTIGATFRAYAVPGHGDIYNPIDNTAAATNYIAARYGAPWNTPGIRSLDRGGSYQGYHGGGIVGAPGTDTSDVLALLQRGEGVVSRGAMGGGGGGFVNHGTITIQITGEQKSPHAVAEEVRDALIHLSYRVGPVPPGSW
ncbi:MAG: transglycosylase SLT domain-containing protein, partial [Acidimicrobiales bacterium]